MVWKWFRCRLRSSGEPDTERVLKLESELQAMRLQAAERDRSLSHAQADLARERERAGVLARPGPASGCAAPIVAPAVSPTPSALDPHRPRGGDGADQLHSSDRAIGIVNDESLPGDRLPR